MRLNWEAGGAAGEMFTEHKSASDTYKAVFLEKIFGGMKDRAAKDPEQGGVSDEVSHSAVLMKDWLNQDISFHFTITRLCRNKKVLTANYHD